MAKGKQDEVLNSLKDNFYKLLRVLLKIWGGVELMRMLYKDRISQVSSFSLTCDIHIRGIDVVLVYVPVDGPYIGKPQYEDILSFTNEVDVNLVHSNIMEINHLMLYNGYANIDAEISRLEHNFANCVKSIRKKDRL